jgi:glycosyltransferase involved in cell wall biosynthesis
MRILHVTECYSAGTGAVVNQLVEALRNDEHHLLWHADADPCVAHGFAGVERMPDGTGHRIRAVADAARRIRPDVIHAHSSWAGIYTRLAGAGVPVVYQPHCFGFVNPSVGRPQRVAARVTETLLASRASAIVAVSPYEEELARRVARHTRTQVVMVPNRASIPERAPAPRHSGSPLVSMIGRVSPQKDPEYFADVASRVRAAAPAVRFRWIGGGTDQGRLQRLTAAGVEITGWLAPDRMSQVLADSDLYLHSASSEGFPISVLDAAAAGLPIVVRNIDAFAGLPLVQATDPADAARRVTEMLARPELLKQARWGAEQLLRVMNVDRQASALAEVYQRVVVEG